MFRHEWLTALHHTDHNSKASGHFFSCNTNLTLTFTFVVDWLPRWRLIFLLDDPFGCILFSVPKMIFLKSLKDWTHRCQADSSWILSHVKLIRSDHLRMAKGVSFTCRLITVQHIPHYVPGLRCCSCSLHVHKHHEAPAEPSHEKQCDMHAVDDQAIKHPKVQAPVT